MVKNNIIYHNIKFESIIHINQSLPVENWILRRLETSPRRVKTHYLKTRLKTCHTSSRRPPKNLETCLETSSRPSWKRLETSWKKPRHVYRPLQDVLVHHGLIRLETSWYVSRFNFSLHMLLGWQRHGITLVMWTYMEFLDTDPNIIFELNAVVAESHYT